VGYLVLDGFGTVHTAGSAQTFEVSEKGNSGDHVSLFSLIFESIETTPVWLMQQSPVTNFVVGSEAYPVST
ncbi:MAG: hypothetical protein ACP5I1_06385, partial [Candidatus Hinthialibacter sp.]